MKISTTKTKTGKRPAPLRNRYSREKWIKSVPSIRSGRTERIEQIFENEVSRREAPLRVYDTPAILVLSFGYELWSGRKTDRPTRTKEKFINRSDSYEKSASSTPQTMPQGLLRERKRRRIVERQLTAI